MPRARPGGRTAIGSAARPRMMGALIALVWAAAVVALGPSNPASAYPDRPVRLVVPFAAGGLSDILCRGLAQRMSEEFGVQFVVENRVGAGGTIATESVVRAAPDGHTILFHSSSLAVNEAVRPDSKVDVQKELLPVMQLVSAPYVLLASPALPAKTAADLIAYAKQNPGKLNYGSPGAGSSGHLVSELFAHEAGIKMVHVPYRGTGPANQALMVNDIQLVFDVAGGAKPLADAGSIRALGLTSTERMSFWPQVPPISETGLPGFAPNIWYGLFVSRHTPASVVDSLTDRLRKILSIAELRSWLEGLGTKVEGEPGPQFERVVAADIKRWKDLVQRIGLK
jgi:tripartite-type tricarboxylate transporter receptor subunit TctC